MASGPNPGSSNENANGIFTRTSTATDRLGNTGSGSFTVRVDKAAPTITGGQTDNGDGTTTVTFNCTDNPGSNASGISSCLADGTSTPSKTVTGPATVNGTATDRAGNTSTATVNVAARDRTAPGITHSVAPAPNAAGWNKADATVTFSCSDNVAVASCVADGTSPASASKTVGTETSDTLVGGTATDTSGNTAKDSVTVKLDKTAPTATAVTDRPANANGWYNADVTVTYVCADSLSGVASCPPARALAQGANQSASGTAVDNAGNTSASAGVSGINVDKTPPVLTGSFSSGWHMDDVIVTWTCTDPLSGPAAQPANSIVTGEGGNLSASAACADVAGNTVSNTVSGIKIDRTAPLTTIAGGSNAWAAGDVTLTLTATDALSGVAFTQYTVDGGSPSTGTTITLSTEGDHTVTFASGDIAGNVEATHTVHVKIDKTAPTITHGFPSPAGYADSAWTNQDVQVTFTCADQGGSGVASCLGNTTVSTEGTAQHVTGTATDGAGNSASDTAAVSIDKTKPTITAASDRRANPAGWYNADVTVSFTCADDRSGVASCPGSKQLGQGANQSASGTVQDTAGNSATDTLSGINVDTTAPVLTGSFPDGWHSGDVTVHWTCTDPLSGPAGQPADSLVTGEGDNLSATATCADKAGNTTTTTVTGIKIDRTPPTTGASVTGTTHNGWYAAGVQVSLDANDNLSDVAKTYYTVDGGSPLVYDAAVPVATDGVHTITFWSVDVAGNVEPSAGHTLTLQIDTTPPTLAGAPTSDPNAAGWYRTDVIVHWTCSDVTAGIDGVCPGDSTVTGEGDALSASASVSDVAGNATNTTVGSIKIDRTAPTTVGSVPAAPASGWYTAPVPVTLTASDNLSGVDATTYSVDGGEEQSYTGPFSVAGDGTHSVTFHSTDGAGNAETAAAPLVLKIDGTARPPR